MRNALVYWNVFALTSCAGQATSAKHNGENHCWIRWPDFLIQSQWKSARRKAGKSELFWQNDDHIWWSIAFLSSFPGRLARNWKALCTSAASMPYRVRIPSTALCNLQHLLVLHGAKMYTFKVNELEGQIGQEMTHKISLYKKDQRRSCKYFKKYWSKSKLFQIFRLTLVVAPLSDAKGSPSVQLGASGTKSQTWTLTKKY